MELSKKGQEQTAGNNSQQNQQIGDNSSQTNIGTQVVINNNIVPAEEWTNYTTTLTTQLTALTLQSCTQVATNIVEQRINNFYGKMLPRIEKIEGVMNHLQDPKFQFMIRDANITAAKSSRTSDLDMLSELLVCHLEKGEDRKIDAGIHKAIQIVDEIDEESLCGLTLIVSILHISPITDNIKEGILVLNDLYSKLMTTDLPKGYDWIDHLSVIGTITLLSGNFYKLEKILSEKLDGYICTGIKAKSDEYNQAISILEKCGCKDSILVPNDCLEGYYRLPIINKNEIRKEWQPILDLYSKDSELLNTVKRNFMNMWDSYDALKNLRIWFENIPAWFRINSVGKALAQTNAKRCYPEFPDLI